MFLIQLPIGLSLKNYPTKVVGNDAFRTNKGGGEV